MAALFNELAEVQYLAAYVQGEIADIAPVVCLDDRYLMATMLAGKGKPDSIETLSLWYAHDGHQIPSWANTLFSAKLPASKELEENIKVLSFLAVRRNITDSSRRLNRLATDFSVPNEELASLVQEEWATAFRPVHELAQEDPTEGAYKWFKEHLEGKAPTGTHQLWCPLMDELIGPIGPDMVMAIAAMTSHGKTIWMNKIILDLASQGMRCMVSSPDMGPNKIWMRFIAMQTGIPYWKIDRHSLTNPTLNGHERSVAVLASEELHDLPIKVERTSNVQELIAKAERWGADFLGVDYAELFRMPGVPGSNYINYDQVAAATLRLADVAWRMAVVIASQVNSNDPDVYNLSWGKNLPRRADVVMWLTRHRGTRITEARVLKNRGKGLGKVLYYVLPPSMQPIELPVISRRMVLVPSSYSL